MSLFGDDDNAAARGARARSSGLFDDEPTPAAAKTSTSLFSDDVGASGEGDDSPWGLPTPKKAARGRSSLVKTLLPAGEVPEGYVDAFDTLLQAEGGHGLVGLEAVESLLTDAGLGGEAQARVLKIVLPDGQEGVSGVERGEFNVLFALVGLAQEGEDVTLDGVDDRRRNLPIPSFGAASAKYQKQKPAAKPPPASPASPAPTPSTTQATTPSASQASIATTATPTRPARGGSFGFESDPWGSPEMHKGHNHGGPNGTSQSNGSSAVPPVTPTRTTSNFTTNSERASTAASTVPPPPSNDAPSWGDFPSVGATDTGFRDSGLGGVAFGHAALGANPSPSRGLNRTLGGNRNTATGPEEVVTVITIPEKEGMFMFQHRNYEVTSVRRNSKVIRRYSDFVWLLDCLHKRYPFRQLPLLPPKRVAINGNYIAADNSFVEKRRRGLARFANALVRHPVLGQEQLVVMFLTVPTELSVWRKQATISVQEEFTGKPLPPTLEDSLPTNLQESFDTVRSGVRRSSELYINLCNILERLAKRNEGVAADCKRFGLALGALTEASADTYHLDTNDVPLLNEGLKATAKHMMQSKALLEDEAHGWEQGVLEDMKRQRDCLVSVRDMFDRRDRYDRDNIPQLEKRIQNNENKLTVIRAKPENLQKPGEAEKVEDAILRDKQSIVNQHARGVFVKECIRDELLFFQQSQHLVGKLHQDWSQERVKYAELQADNWRGLVDQLEGMSLGE